MKKLLTLFAVLLSVLSQAQTIVAYRVSTIGGVQQVIAIYSDGSRKAVSTLPPDRPYSRKGGRVALPYQPEGPQQWNIDQFGLDKYYSPNFRFSIDWNPAQQTVNERKRRGINLFNMWSINNIQEKLDLPFGDGMAFKTESELHGSLEGWEYFKASLQQYEQYIWDHTIPAGTGTDVGVKYVIYDIEHSISMSKGYFTGNSFWPSWDSVKDYRLTCEFDGVNRSLAEIDAAGDWLWEAESATRRSNRVKILMKITRAKAGNPNVKIAWGASLDQGEPNIAKFSSNGVFMEGNANVDHAGGSNGTITLNGRTYTGMTGSPWDEEDFMLGYYYVFNGDIKSQQDYQDIWIDKKAGTQNIQYVWSRLKPYHVVADEKAYIQQNRRLMMARQGKLRPIIRMTEPMYEGGGVYVDAMGGVPGPSVRLPFAQLQTNVTGDDPPKLWIEPYIPYSRYCVVRFFAGDEPGWGYHCFPVSPSHIGSELTNKYYNFELHTQDAYLHARNDMQPYEKYYAGSTLVEDPEVQIDQTGSWSSYDGTYAYNNNAGSRGPKKPSFMLRYKPLAGGGWRVLVLGGHSQDHGVESTHMVRVPGGGLNGNMFRIKLTGPSAQVYEFIVRASDSNQVYEATPTLDPNWSRPGYGGRTRNNELSGLLSLALLGGGLARRRKRYGVRQSPPKRKVSALKSLLLLLPLLWSVFSQAQTVTGTGSQTLTIAPASGFTGTPYVIKVRRDINTYPLTTQGFDAFAAKVSQGAFSYTVVSNGCVVAAGTPPPLTAPTCSQSVPSWVTGLQWKHDGTTLTIQSAGDVAQVAFGTSPASTFSTTNPDGVAIQSGTFYSPKTVSNGSYNHEWQINKAQTTFAITLKNSSGATYDRTFSTPITGNLFTALVGTATNPVSTTNPPSSSGLAGDPRTLVGTRNGNNVYSGTGLNYLLEVFSSNPDQFAPRGKNLTGLSLTGTIPSNVVDTDFSGLAAPTGFTTPSGYSLQTFPDGSAYYKQTTTTTTAVAGDPRTQIGTRNGNPIYSGTGLNYLLEVFSSNPDQFAPRGANLIFSKTGTIPSNVVNSDFGGLAAPTGTVKPSGYRNRYFPDGALYFEKSTAADETPPGSTTTTSPGSTTGSTSMSNAVLSGKFADLDALTFPSQNITQNLQVLENSVALVGFSAQTGMCITDFRLKSNNVNQINTYILHDQNGQPFEDKGRSVQFFSQYWNPAHAYITPAGHNTATFTQPGQQETGANSVQGGTVGPYHVGSQIITSGFLDNVPGRGRVFFAHIRPMIWTSSGDPSPHTGKLWAWLDGPVLKYRILHFINPEPAQAGQLQRGRNQEGPCVMTRASNYRHRIVVGQPWVNTPPIAMLDAEPWVENTNTFGKRINSSECWVGQYDTNDFGVTLYTPTNASFIDSQAFSRQGEAPDDALSYASAVMNRNYNQPGIYEDYGYIIVGTQTDARNIITNQLERPDQTFDFNFSKNNQLWFNDNAEAFHDGTTMKVDMVEWRANENRFYGGNIWSSPERAWTGSSVRKLEFTFASTDVNQLAVYFEKPNQGGLDSYYQRKLFNVISDGQPHTYTVDMSDMFGASETIVKIGLQLPIDKTSFTGNEQIRPTRTRAIANAASDWQAALSLSLLAGGIARRRRKALGIRTRKSLPVRLPVEPVS